MELAKFLSIALILALTLAPTASAEIFEQPVFHKKHMSLPVYQRSDERALAQYVQLAQESFYERNYPDAERNLTAALAIDPKRSAIWFNLAACLLLDKRLVESKHYFEKSLAVSPQRAEAYFFMGTIYDRLRDTARANSCYQHFVDVYPPHLVDSNQSVGPRFCAQYLPYVSSRIASNKLNAILKECLLYEVRCDGPRIKNTDPLFAAYWSHNIYPVPPFLWPLSENPDRRFVPLPLPENLSENKKQQGSESS